MYQPSIINDFDSWFKYTLYRLSEEDDYGYVLRTVKEMVGWSALRWSCDRQDGTETMNVTLVKKPSIPQKSTNDPNWPYDISTSGGS